MRLLLFTLVAVLAAHGQEPEFIPEVGQPLKQRPGGFHLELLPKAFMSDPQIEMTVYSERTEYGRTLPDVTPGQPAYYVAQSQGYQPMGSSPVSEHPPAQEKIEALLQRVLEKRGYLPARDLAHPPTLALFTYWGTHSGIDVQEVVERPDLITLRERDILERARLVGGRANVEKLARQMAYGIPLHERMAREEHLRYQAEHNLYYVVVSAYDFARLAQGERRLVWRTTMTVNDQGVSIKETLPPLIASALDFFGRDTGESLALQRRISRGSVTLGPLIIIGSVPPELVPVQTK
jgi:hypothetical protein